MSKGGIKKGNAPHGPLKPAHNPFFDYAPPVKIKSVEITSGLKKGKK